MISEQKKTLADELVDSIAESLKEKLARQIPAILDDIRDNDMDDDFGDLVSRRFTRRLIFRCEICHQTEGRAAVEIKSKWQQTKDHHDDDDKPTLIDVLQPELPFQEEKATLDPLLVFREAYSREAPEKAKGFADNHNMRLFLIREDSKDATVTTYRYYEKGKWTLPLKAWGKPDDVVRSYSQKTDFIVYVLRHRDGREIWELAYDAQDKRNHWGAKIAIGGPECWDDTRALETLLAEIEACNLPGWMPNVNM